MFKFLHKKLNSYITDQLTNYVTQEQLIDERIKVIDVCIAHVVVLAARFRVLEEELRRQESLSSIAEIDRKTRERLHSDFVGIMQYYDQFRKAVAELVIQYRQENPPENIQDR